MLDTAALYGRLGPDGGDSQVVDLLRRTHTSLRKADQDWRRLRSEVGGPVYNMPLARMTVLYDHWLSSLWWQLALVFTDAMLIQHDGAMPPEMYRIADILCDNAADHVRHTAQIFATYNDTGRPPLAQTAGLPPLVSNRLTYLGVWDAANEIVGQVNDDWHTITTLGVPSRMEQVHAGITKVVHASALAAATLRADWASTTMADNRMALAKQLWEHATKMFVVGQQLWAPYLVGAAFKQALQKEKNLDELDLGFDPWVLTDPRKRTQLDATAARELVRFWESVANRDAVPALVQQMDEALRSGALRRRTTNGCDTVPWQSRFLVIRPITLGGVQFQPRQTCAYFPANRGTTTIEIRRAGAVRGTLELMGQT